MCEVTIDNFKDIYSKIEGSFQNAKFITLDTEFSALQTSDLTTRSLFDTPSERYEKLRQNCEATIPVQIGLSAFIFEPEINTYLAEMFTFYVYPRPFGKFNPRFMCESSSLQFLCNYKFDFNKFIYKGISFVNRSQESTIRSDLKTGEYTSLSNIENLQADDLMKNQCMTVSSWYYSCKEGDTLVLPGIYEKYKNSYDLLYFLHKYLRHRFNKTIWTTQENGEFVVKKVSKKDFELLEEQNNLDEELLDNLLGFTKIFGLLVHLKKPIIGHNLIVDLMYLYQYCEGNLPKSYTQFKKHLHDLLPDIYDTKVIATEIKNMIPVNKMWASTCLNHLYEYFKDGYGRHVVMNSPIIELKNSLEYDDFHNAGWDSYCTGYIFLRLAHVLTASKYNVNKRKFMCCELFGSVENYKNSLNLIACSVSHIKLDSEDPISTRPPCLVIESTKNKPVNITQVTALLSQYGFIEVKPYSSRGRRAIVAVDNFGSAKRILVQFKDHTDFQIKQYSVIRHSPVARAVMWSGVVASGALVAWLANSVFKK